MNGQSQQTENPAKKGKKGSDTAESVDVETVKTEIEQLRTMGLTKMYEIENSKELQNLKVELLGKKGSITSMVKVLGKLTPEQRPVIGAIVNEVKEELEQKFELRKAEVEELEIEKSIVDDKLDVTMPGIGRMPGHVHPIRATIQRAMDIFLDLGYQLVDDPEMSPEIETDYYCFEALNCPADHPARDMQDTLYLTDDQKYLLRTHTSSVQARFLEKVGPPFGIVCPGRVYRRDALDATHSFQFHQMEIMLIDKNITLGNLRATVIHFLEQMLGKDIKVRFRGSYFPFTEPSMEVDVFYKGRWLEVLGCGMVDPAVLEKAGYDPTEWTGFAAGFGIERFAMVIHQITDIREFTNNNMEFLEQFDFPYLRDA